MTVQPLPAERAAGPQPATRAETTAQSRLLYIDNLRILLTTLVILHHLSIGYGASGLWYYNEEGPLNTVSAILLGLYTSMDQAFFMGMFFMISSHFCPRSYDHRGAGPFLTSRLKRLGIPLLVFYLVVQPLMVYGLNLLGGYRGTFAGFVAEGFRGGGYGPGPLWFVGTLLVFNLAYVLWRKIVPPLSSEDRPAPGNGAIALFTVGLAALTWVVRVWFPMGTQWRPFGIDLGLQLCYFAQYVVLFAVGAIAYRRNWFERLTNAQGRFWARLIPVMALLYVVVGVAVSTMDDSSAFNGGLHWQSFISALWEQLTGMAIIVALIVWFRNRVNRQGPLARAMSGAAYAAYVVHAPVIVLLALALSGIRIDMSLKWVLVAPFAVALTYLVAVGIRKIPLVRSIL